MKIYRFVSILVAAAFLLVACGGTPVESTKSPLRLAVNLWPGLYPAAIAQEQGFFAKHNVQVEIHYYEAYPDTYSDLLLGKVDGLSAIVGDTLLINNQKNLKFVFPVDASDGADVIIVGDDVQSAADLKGKRIGAGFGTYGELYVRTFLQQNGLSPADVSLVNSLPKMRRLHINQRWTPFIPMNPMHLKLLQKAVMFFPRAVIHPT